MARELRDSAGRVVRLLRPLGKGGFGSVWLAEVRDPSGLVHRMAVKLLHEALAKDSDLAARARDEARLMSQLNHDHVVKVHALTELEGRSAVLMEFVEGIDCTALLSDCRERGEPGLPVTVAAAIVERAAGALHAAWTGISPQTGQPLRVVHRDIKPANLLLSVLGVVKVMDFGVARAEFDREAETQSVQFGTQRYMAPERWLVGEAGPASDVYSLGVTLWELLAGTRFERLPLQEEAYYARLEQQLGELRVHTPLDPDAADRVELVLRGMMRFQADQRSTALQVEEALGGLLESTRGPELRRWARRRVPTLLQRRMAALDRDVDPLSGTLAVAEVQETPSPMRVTAEETSMDAPQPAATQATAPQPEPAQSTQALPAPTPPAPEQPTRLGLYLGAGLGLLLVLGLGGWGISALVPEEPLEVEPSVEELVVEAPLVEPEPEPEPEPEVVEVEEPAPEPVVAAPKTRARPAAQPEPAVVELELEPEPEPEAPTQAPPLVVVKDAGPRTVSVKILARPIDGSTQVLGRTVPVKGSVDLPVGETVRLKHTWDDAQSLSCEKVVAADMSKVFFDQESRSCSY